MSMEQEKYNFDVKMELAKVAPGIYPEEVAGTSFSGLYLNCSYTELVRVFGEPTEQDASADGKVNCEWVFSSKEKTVVVTIYDYKEEEDPRDQSLTDIYWHVGGKGLDKESLRSFLKTAIDASERPYEVSITTLGYEEKMECPGCGRKIPKDSPMNALSRYDHGDICSSCGTMEAVKGDFISQQKAVVS